jgi:hypothetical protein
VCEPHKRETFALSHLLQPYPSRNLDVDGRIYIFQINSGKKSGGMCIVHSVE